MKNRITHADELPYDGTAAGLVADDVQAAIDEVAAAPSDFDPDEPLPYFTMTDTDNGDVVVVTIVSGAWVLTTVDPLTTEGSDRMTTEGGDVLTLE